MSQNQATGAAGNSFGRETAPRIAAAIGATMLGRTSNEALLNGHRVVIKSARSRTQSVGVTYLMLERLKSIIGAFQGEDGAFEVFALPADEFRAHMTETRSTGAAAGKVGIVAKRVFLAEGKLIAKVPMRESSR